MELTISNVKFSEQDIDKILRAITNEENLELRLLKNEQHLDAACDSVGIIDRACNRLMNGGHIVILDKDNSNNNNWPLEYTLSLQDIERGCEYGIGSIKALCGYIINNNRQSAYYLVRSVLDSLKELKFYDLLDNDFYNVELDDKGNKIIHVEGYVYCSDNADDEIKPFRHLTYRHNYIPVGLTSEEFNERLEDNQNNCAQDIKDLSKYDAVNMVAKNDATPLSYGEVTQDTPCGYYYVPNHDIPIIKY